MSYKKFRLDINSLRALAVLSVVLYHFGVPYVSGGFVGVDVFFVISGFLMTGIVLERVDHKGVLDFYIARFLRIVPALVFLIIIMIVIGLFILSTNEYEILSKNAIASLLFYSNKYYAIHSSYFEPSSENNFFLHTWSLSVEWQFYLLFPIIVIFIKKCKIPLILSLIFIWLASFITMILLSNYNQTDVFYSLSTRAWEMISGGLVYAHGASKANDRNRTFLSYLGIILIIISIFTIDSKKLYPSAYTLLPVLGAVIFITANNQESKFIKNGILQFIGKISYSWYLWHWPVIVLMRYYNFDFNTLNTLIGISVSLLFALISFFLIETPYKNRNKILFEFVFSLSLLTACVFVSFTNGMNFRFNGDMKDIASYRFNNKNWRPDTCFLNPNQDYRQFDKCPDKMTSNSVVVWGDSHAAHLMPGLQKNYEDINFTQRTASLCGPLPGAENNQRPFCKNINTHVLNEIISIKPKLVVLSAFWSQYPFDKYLADTLKVLHEAGIRTIVIGPFPFWREPLPKEIEKNGLNTQRTLPVEFLESKKHLFENEMKLKIISQRNNAHFISALSILCSHATCKATVGESPVRPMQWDNAHLTDSGSKWFINKIKDDLY
ncbi:UNVERIFIED_ORG: peptidoglycan/LPS O-acetylase OafA/YrhL [Kosakonia oryzae]|nr:peptidoglycan/LPS O-acetylase OafA/YrhL [Kosakonia oryzae]